MSYTKHEFKSGKKLFASQLNEMDEQIFKNEKMLSEIGGTTVEPAEDDIPKIFLTGDAFSDMTTAKNEVQMMLEYISKSEHFTSGIKIKYQGNSSLQYPKKNFTIKLYTDGTYEEKLKRDFRGWGKQNKYVLKANYIDHSHARNIMSARLWEQIVASRGDYDILPDELRTSPCNGAIDGFPVKLYVNGVYQGLYTWNIPKDAWMFNMNEDNPNHAVLCAEYNNSATPGQVGSNPSCEFREVWGGNSDGSWSVEVPDSASTAIVTSFNNLIKCVKDTDDATFKATIGNHLDLQSAFDYYLYAYYGCFFDNLGKNMLMVTYDGIKWYCSMYDMDNVWGLRFTKTSLPQPYDTQCPEGYGESYSLLWQRIEKLYYNELKARYTELRKTVLSETNIINTLERFTDVINKDLLAEDVIVYPGVYFPDVDHVRQIRTFVVQRAAYVDAEIAALDGTSFCDRDGDGVDDYGVPCTGITLSADTLSFNGAGTQTLTATVTPENTTDTLVWGSTYPTIANVKDGIVTAVGDGTCEIIVTCGSQTAICSVTVSGIGEDGIYKMYSGEYEYYNVHFTVSGNHFKSEPIHGQPGAILAVSDTQMIAPYNSNGVTWDKWFTIPAGATVELIAYNSTITDLKSYCSLNLMSPTIDDLLFTGTTASNTSDGLTRTKTFTESVDVGSVVIASNITLTGGIEFDIKVLVDGERWI